MLFAFRLVANCVRGVSPPCTKGILEQGGANGLKFTLDCPTLFFSFLFSCKVSQELCKGRVHFCTYCSFQHCWRMHAQ